MLSCSGPSVLYATIRRVFGYNPPVLSLEYQR
jgi:hypothetical protein